MLISFFFVLGVFIGWKTRSTKAGVWITNQFSKATSE